LAKSCVRSTHPVLTSISRNISTRPTSTRT